MSLCLTSSPGCGAAVLLRVDPQLWPVHTGDPTSRPHPPQTVETHMEPVGLLAS